MDEIRKEFGRPNEAIRKISEVFDIAFAANNDAIMLDFLKILYYTQAIESALQSAREKRDTAQAEIKRLRETLIISANYFGVFGVTENEKGPSFGEVGRSCAEALGYSGDSYSNSKWGEPTKLSSPSEQEKAVCEWIWDTDGYWKASCGLPWYMSNGEGLKENDMNFCPKCGKPIVQRKEKEE